MEEIPTDDKRAPDVISAVLRYGSMQRSDINLATRTPEKTAQSTLTELVHAGFLNRFRQRRRYASPFHSIARESVRRRRVRYAGTTTSFASVTGLAPR